LKPSAAQLRELARRDPVLGRAMKALPSFPGFPDATSRRSPSHYDALARAIVFQQLATKAAQTIHGRVCALTEGPHFPRPEEVAKLPDAALRGAGLSQNKLLAVRDLAGRVEDGRLDLERIARKKDARVVEELVLVRGIGEWSAHMFLLFRLGRLDVFAPGDLGVREGMRLLDGDLERPTPKAAEARALVWSPLRSVGTWMMWRILERERARKSPH
jgi:DNA-3-methyladenine glycosylase II